MRPLTLATLSILLGALTTIAVAWTLVLLPNRSPIVFGFGRGVQARGAEPAVSAMFTIIRRRGFDTVMIQPMAEPLSAAGNGRMLEFMQHHYEQQLSEQEALYLLHPPPWLMLPRADDPSVTQWVSRAAGWPFPSLRSVSLTPANSAAPQLRYAIQLPEIRAPRPNEPHRNSLPLLPYWPAFLASITIYTPPWLLILLTPHLLHRLRRHLRLRRGHCLHCGYDIQRHHSSPCPECGRASMLRQ